MSRGRNLVAQYSISSKFRRGQTEIQEESGAKRKRKAISRRNEQVRFAGFAEMIEFSLADRFLNRWNAAKCMCMIHSNDHREHCSPFCRILCKLHEKESATPLQCFLSAALLFISEIFFLLHETKSKLVDKYNGNESKIKAFKFTNSIFTCNSMKSTCLNDLLSVSYWHLNLSISHPHRS